MRTLWISVVLLLLVGSVAFAGQEVPAFEVDANGNIGPVSELARVWKAGGYEYKCNANRVIPVMVCASLAQWIDFRLEATEVYWRVLKPGDYAMDGIGLQLRSNGDVCIDYEGFEDLINDEGDIIPTWYAVTVGGAQPAPGDWVRAIDLNDDDDVIPEDQRHENWSFSIWNRIAPFDCDSACEYCDRALITVIQCEQKPWVDSEEGGFLADFPDPPPWPPWPN
jgi:hypothetical protein